MPFLLPFLLRVSLSFLGGIAYLAAHIAVYKMMRWLSAKVSTKLSQFKASGAPEMNNVINLAAYKANHHTRANLMPGGGPIGEA